MNPHDPIPTPGQCTVLAIDPGKDQGWAMFRAGVLVDCGLGTVPGHVRRPDVVVAEKPWIRPQGKSPAGPNVFIEEAIHMTETLCGLVPEERITAKEKVYVYPHEWKGSADKDRAEARVLPSLSRAERDILRRGWGTTTKSKTHNVTEAVGIGLFFLRRLL